MITPFRLGIRRFFRQAGIREKLLFPFFAITVVMTCLGVLSVIQLYSTVTNRDISRTLSAQQQFVTQAVYSLIGQSVNQADIYEQLALASKTRSAKRLLPVFQDEVKENDGIRLYPVRSLSRVQRSQYAELIRANGPNSLVQLERDSASYAIEYVSRVGSSRDRVLAVARFDYPFFNLIKAKNGFDSAFVYLPEGQAPVLISSLAMSQSDLIRDRLVQMATVYRRSLPDSPRFRLDLNGVPMRVSFMTTALSPEVLSVTFVPIDGFLLARWVILFSALALLIGVNFVLFKVYSIVISPITKSIDRLSDAASDVAQGDLRVRVPVESNDRVGRLARSFNHMVEQLQRSTSQIVSEKNQCDAIISNLPEAIVVTDLSQKLILANQYAEQLFRFSCESQVGMNLWDALPESDLSNMLKDHYDTLADGWSEVKISRSNRKPLYFAITSRVVFQSTGERVGLATVIRDITNERELDDVREGFLRTVSHELRTPLTSIIGFSDLITKEPLSEKQSKYLTVVRQNAEDLKTMITELLELSSLESGHLQLNKSTVTVADFVATLASEFDSLASEKHLELGWDIASGIEANVDLQRLRRVLSILVSNAIKFTDEGGIMISVTRDDGDIQFAIQDTGVGIDDKELPHIFDKFRQADYSITREYFGIGLGLPIVKEIIALHDGRVWVESEFGVGTTVYFTLPTSREAVEA